MTTDSERRAESAALDAAYAEEIGSLFAVLIDNLAGPQEPEASAPDVRFTKGLALLRAARRLALQSINGEVNDG